MKKIGWMGAAEMSVGKRTGEVQGVQGAGIRGVQHTGASQPGAGISSGGVGGAGGCRDQFMSSRFSCLPIFPVFPYFLHLVMCALAH